MGEDGQGKMTTVATQLAAVEHSALVKVAKRDELPVAELVRIFIAFGMEKLAAGDAELLRAVKGSRDAGLR